MSKNVVTFDIDMADKILSRNKAKEFKALSSKKGRDMQGLFMVEGNKSVTDSIAAFPLEYLICTRDWIDKNEALAHLYPEKILISDKKGIEIISSLNSLPEVIAVFQKPKERDLIPRLNPQHLYVLLDEIQDPGNLGTIIRTCDWFGIYDIYASRNTVDVYSPKVVQSTMGSLSRVRVHYTDLERLIKNNPEIKVIGTLLEGKPLEDYKSIDKGFLLMGNEGRGISESLKELIDFPLTIPPVNPKSHPDSLNVAVATAIVLSHLKTSKI